MSENKDNHLKENHICNHNHNHKHNHSHGHGHGHSHHHHHSGDNIGSAFLINGAFTIIELFGGLFTNSTAILSDAIHDLGDTISLGMSWFLEKKSSKEADNKFTYGYGRYSILGSMLNILILTIGTMLVLFNTIPRLINPQPVNAKGMLFLAILGVIMNGLAVLKVKNGEKISEKVVMLHLLEDVLGWVAVLIVSIVLYFIDIPILDPLLSLAISLYIIKNIINNTKSIINIILQKTPENIDISELSTVILNAIPFKAEINSIKIWSIDGENHVVDLNISLFESIDFENLDKLREDIKNELSFYNITQTTIEFNINKKA